jgi:hypothetical protein
MTDRVAGSVMRLSIRMRLTLWNASVLALVLGTFAVAGWLTLTTTLQQRTDTAVRESARVVAGAIRAERAAAQARGDVEEVRGETEQAVLRELRVGDPKCSSPTRAPSSWRPVSPDHRERPPAGATKP